MKTESQPSQRRKTKRARELAQLLKAVGTADTASKEIRQMAQSFLEVDRGLRRFTQMNLDIERDLKTAARLMGSPLLDLDRLLEPMRKAARAMAELEKSPKGRAFRKMANSKGVLHPLEEDHNVLFIPDAVSLYGFGHLPTKSDPQGKLYQELPATPERLDRLTGAYLFMPEPGSRNRGDDLERHPLVQEAIQAFKDSGKLGTAPTEVLTVLMADSGMEEVWVSIDPTGDVDAQFRAFKRRLNKIERQLYPGGAKTRRKRREPARDTLIYALRESRGLSIRDIAKRVFRKEYSERTAESQEDRVRVSLFRTRRALRASKGGPTFPELP